MHKYNLAHGNCKDTGESSRWGDYLSFICPWRRTCYHSSLCSVILKARSVQVTFTIFGFHWVWSKGSTGCPHEIRESWKSKVGVCRNMMSKWTWMCPWAKVWMPNSFFFIQRSESGSCWYSPLLFRSRGGTRWKQHRGIPGFCNIPCCLGI